MVFDKSQQSYQDLRSIFAEKSDSIVAWVGAGLSIPAGLPSWPILRQSLIEELESDANREVDSLRRKERLNQCRLAESETDFWKSFSIIAKAMGHQTYRAAIRRTFRGADSALVPESYRHLWRLGISGMINLNIDRFAKRAFTEVNDNKIVNDFNGKTIADFIHLLRSPKPWLANLHGEIDAASSWVFTANELDRLFQNPAYDQLIKTCFAARTVVFMGISADDIAAGEHLRKLTDSGVDCGGHFWITHDQSKRDLAETAGIRQINYASDNNHAELTEVFEDLLHAKSLESPAVPVVLTKVDDAVSELPQPDVLETRQAVEIRQILNSHASRILAETNEDSVAEFEKFASDYSEAIYRAWYVDVAPPKNELLGYRITELCKEGAFGTVYRATNSSGQQFAIKILHEKVRKNREMLQSFRRGVASMRILTDNGVDGVVHYHDASEIPAMVVMDFIEGIDLVEATKKNVLFEWEDLIRICKRLTEIIRTSHRLPQRVLHRDIRPSNVIIENCWGPSPRWEETKLWVLDFDLSHHLDSFDVSVSQPGQANGYLAPEQVERNNKVSTRNATVDSFGLGMTFYYLRTGVEPWFAQHRYGDWIETLKGVANNYPCKKWRSLPFRFCRMMYNATQESQENRLEVANIENELIWLEQVLTTPKSVVSAELLAEELAARGFDNIYEWDRDSISATREIANIKLRLIGEEAKQQIRLEFAWLQGGQLHHQDVRRWLPKAREQVESILTKSDWQVSSQINTGQFRGAATTSIKNVRSALERHSAAIGNVADALSFS